YCGWSNGGREAAPWEKAATDMVGPSSPERIQDPPQTGRTDAHRPDRNDHGLFPKASLPTGSTRLLGRRAGNGTTRPEAGQRNNNSCTENDCEDGFSSYHPIKLCCIGSYRCGILVPGVERLVRFYRMLSEFND